MQGDQQPITSIPTAEPIRAKAKSRYPKVDGLPSKQIKEYTLLSEMGLDELVPIALRHIFSKRDENGNHSLPIVYKDQINAHGFGGQFIDELRAKKGPSFAKAIKEPMTKAKYVQA